MIRFARFSCCREGGFSLIELIIVMAVIGLLLGLAIPGYQHYMQRSRRSDALEALYRLQQAQLRYRGFHPGYAKDLAELTPKFDAASRQGYYRLSTGVDGDERSSYFVEADVQAGGMQAGDSECQRIRLSQRQHTVNLSPTACWGKR
ncbi:type IV pilin protein [Chromobacterium sp. IIBBL 290-4]|uniref:type IV pilin protein n=1 Tax=Chromobacterium sp. IIBBL 290-4 TaxID=2953890 RepID=UPI0020B7C84B|nr:type IV pilin protein [Chromobacterium sp. IIBBL 290-4]UTH76512.1 prepilin-type N-terminal cleavage/methylation domain-containing protein [Chromobacterium sp. IIBBL 290-4]